MGGTQDSYRLSRTALAEQEYPLRPTVHSWSAILPPLLTYPPSKCLSVNAAPHAHRDLPQLPEPETFNPALSCRKMPIAPPRPPSPLRCPPRSTDLSILSRSLARPRKAGQRGRGGRRKGGVVYPRIPPYPPVRRLQATLHITSILIVGVSAIMQAAVTIQSAHLQQMQAMLC